MHGARRPIGLNRPAPIDVVLLAVIGPLTLVTGLMAAVPSLQVRFVAPELDLVLDTVTTLVTVSVAVLAWIRFRELGEPVALFQSAAFLAFGVSNGLTLLLVTSGLDHAAGMSLEDPGQAPLYVFAALRILAGGLLVVGTLASLRDRQPRHPRAILFGSATVMILAIALAQAYAPGLPALGSVSTLSDLNVGSTAIPVLPTVTILGALVQVLGAALFLWAAALSRRLYLRNRSIGDGVVAVGLVFAAFAQVQATLYPSTYAGVVAGGDFLRVAFDFILLLGIQAAARATLSELRVANIDLARLRGIEVDRAAVDERSRLSRELHDGLAQDLWLAKLKTSRLAGLPDLGPEAMALTTELGSAIDAGLAEAQHAVTALRIVGDPGEPVARVVDDLRRRLRRSVRGAGRDHVRPSFAVADGSHPGRGHSDRAGGAEQCSATCRCHPHSRPSRR